MTEFSPKEPIKTENRVRRLIEGLINFARGYQSGVESAQIDNFSDMLHAIEKHGSLEAAQKAEPKTFTAGGILSILAGHPGKGPKTK